MGRTTRARPRTTSKASDTRHALRSPPYRALTSSGILLWPTETGELPLRTLRHTPESEAVVYLREADATLGRVIDAVGTIELTLGDDRFTSLARAIVGQQLSVSAASTIWSRFAGLADRLDAATVAGLDDDSLRGVGLSRAKAAYVRDLAVRVLDGTVELDQFDAMSDEAVIEELTRVKGIGRWTAEMFLIFSLGRPDVFAVDDVGLKRSIGNVFGADVARTASELTSLAERWRPYRSVASLYLWEALDGKTIELLAAEPA